MILDISLLASSLCAIARTVAAIFDGKDHVRQVVAEMDSTMLFVSSAGRNSVLAVLADRTADAGVLGYEMSQLVKSVQPFLASQPRMRGGGEKGSHSGRTRAPCAAPGPPGPC